MINKGDLADPMALAPILHRETGAIVVSAHTGEGHRQAARAGRGSPAAAANVAVDLLLPYDRGDLVSRIHSEGAVDQLEHTGDGTRLTARVHPQPGGRPDAVRGRRDLHRRRNERAPEDQILGGPSCCQAVSCAWRP